ncbi:MAG: radical SAM family heme chaperone HemW [Actinomycetota bacterium]
MPSLLDLIRDAPRLGLYVHIPFCSSLCPYCDFAVVVGRDADHERYIDAVLAEARARAEEHAWNPFQTVFIGGGTPTQIPAEATVRLIQGVREIFGFAEEVELTLEANPESVEPADIELLAAAGMNRVSIGAQSFDPETLSRLGRQHGPDSIVRAVAAVRAAGIASVNLDLIYGTAGEDDRSWRSTLEQALRLEPDHLSCYGLGIEERTVFGKRAEAGEQLAVDDDQMAERFEVTVAELEAAGLRQYEVSNFARPGHECRHNLGIWCGGDYLGLGLGAHSLRAAQRWWNTRNLGSYLEAPSEAREGEETLDADRRAEEWITTRIRLRAGFPKAVADTVLPDFSARAAPLIDSGLLEEAAGGYVRTTIRGMLLENEVNLRLLA